MTIVKSTTHEHSEAPVEWVPNRDRVYGEHDFDSNVAILLTVQCVARCADRVRFGG